MPKETYNIVSFETGISHGTVKADNYEQAKYLCLDKGVNIYDDYFLEEIK
jgi:hypothetical protein